MIIERRSEFSQRAMQDLKSRSSPGMLFYLLLVPVVFLSHDFYKHQTELCLWFGALLSVICFLRLIHILVQKRLLDTHRSLNNAIFFTNVAITSLIWGGGFARVMVLDGEHATKILMAICSAGLSAGGVVSFIPNLRLAIFYNFALLAPSIILMSLHQINLPLAAAFLIFSVYLVFMANRGNREYWQALENEHLLMKRSEQLSILSRIDGLTGLYNRRYFDECLDLEWKKTSRIQMPPTAIICDIDFFKKINDQHGHQAGDEFLRHTASLLRTVFRRDTDIIARFGGEEFIVLLTDTTPQKALDLAEELRRRMARLRMPNKGINIAATLSIGVASASPVNSKSRDALIARADMALYQAKREGRNRTIVAPDFKPSQQNPV